jgi:adenylylsulfate kinase
MTIWVILAGLPATGKSTLARALAGRLDAATLDKDRIRCAIFGDAFTDYTREQDNLVMRAMLEAAASLTARGRPAFIVFDGRTFARNAQLDAVIGAAKEAGAAWRILHLSCSDQTAEERLERLDRVEPGEERHPARNRNLALYRRLQQDFQPIPHAKLEIDTTLGIETQLDAICSYLDGGPLA